MQELALVMAGERPDRDQQEFARLVKLAKAGDRAAFEALLIRHERQVLLTALRLLDGNLHDAQDAAQQVFLKLHRHLHRLDEKRCFSSWLYRVTVNVCRDMTRSRLARRTVSLEEVNEMAGPVTLEDAFSRSQQSQMLYQALGRLTEKERAVLVLRDLEGLSTKEVARILGSLEVTVRSQISHARLKIRKFMERHSRRRS